ncbi:MAG: gamma-glutamyltransferase [Caldilineaceae bacterium]|nr:gamma-glutamyltransferase [Caldilineaceae bacterium]
MPGSSAWRTRAHTHFTTEKTSASGTRGVVVTNHPLGSAAGAEMLALGGNAIDAAVAALFALNVVEPMMVGLFGAGWTNIRLADGRAIILDNYATAPQAATPDLYRPIADTWPNYMETDGRENTVGYRAVGAPGTLKAWCELVAQWGKLDLETVLQPAIRHAKRGFQASGYLCELIATAQADLARFPASASVFLPEGQPPRPGDLIVQADLAESLTAIAQAGPELLYGGALGQTIIDDMQRNGGILSMDDLRAYATLRRDPLTASYRGYDVTVPAPPCAGGVHLLQILRILEGYNVAELGYGTADMIHLLAECFKIAFADRAAYLGDPAQVTAPIEWLISADYADERRRQIDMQHGQAHGSGTPPSTESSNTTHVTVADGDGNIACMTQTINSGFGSKVMVPGTGILLNNTMALFDPHPGQPNSVQGGRRMTSSMCPTIITRHGQPFLALGTPGGVRIFPSVLQAITNVIDHGMSLQAAVEAPRVWTQGQELEVEAGIPQAVRTTLAERGHRVVEVNTVAGGMNGVLFDVETAVMTGAACWRADGTPIALAGGPARPGIRFRPAVVD